MAADYRRSMDDQTTIFIDNEHVTAEASDRITVINPATAETIGSVPDCGPADIDRAVEILIEIMATEAWDTPEYRTRKAVT